MKQNVYKQYLMVGCVLLVILVGAILSRGIGSEEKEVSQTEEAQRVSEENIAETEAKSTSDHEVEIVIPGSNPNVRVQICSGNYAGKYHESITLQCSSDYTVTYGDTVEEHTADEPVWFTPDDPWLAQGKVTLTPKDVNGQFSITDLQRSQDNPIYYGSFEVEKTENGLQVINELPLETYLCSVVPSEMPSKYPLEALKAQAVCARTYALKHIQAGRTEGKPADMDDSVSFQVYNNIARNEKTDQAVKETEGQVLMSGETLVDALYYSTSCGIDMTKDYSEEAVFCAFISDSNNESYEKDEPWYRWKNYYSLEELTRLAAAGINEEIGNVKSLTVLERDGKGAASRLQVDGDAGSAVIEGEYNIRKYLQTDQAAVTLQDGKTAPNLEMLPSAFFYLIPDNEGDTLKGYSLTGGGYGHGTGLSQNGARHMADKGKSYREILSYYYG